MTKNYVSWKDHSIEQEWTRTCWECGCQRLIGTSTLTEEPIVIWNLGQSHRCEKHAADEDWPQEIYKPVYSLTDEICWCGRPIVVSKIFGWLCPNHGRRIKDQATPYQFMMYKPDPIETEETFPRLPWKGEVEISYLYHFDGKEFYQTDKPKCCAFCGRPILKAIGTKEFCPHHGYMWKNNAYDKYKMSSLEKVYAY